MLERVVQHGILGTNMEIFYQTKYNVELDQVLSPLIMRQYARLMPASM